MKTRFKSLILSSLLTVCVASPSLADNTGSAGAQKNQGNGASSPKATGSSPARAGGTGSTGANAARSGAAKPTVGALAASNQTAKTPAAPLQGQIQRHVKAKVSAVSKPDAAAIERKLLSEPYDPSSPGRPFHEPLSNDPDAPTNHKIRPVSSNAH